MLWARDVYGNVDGIVTTPDSRVAIAALSDGTLRWYALDTGRELLALFPHPDGHRWVAWTPSGYYMASADGDALIGWQVNHGRQQVGDFFPVGRFEDQYMRPDIVTKTLALRDEQKAIRAAAADGKAGASKTVVQMLPPVIDIVSPQPNVVSSDKTLRIAYRVRTPSGAPIKQITARVDGHLLGPFAAPSLDAGGTGAADLVFPLPQHDTDILLFAENQFGASEPAKVAVQWRGVRTDPGDAPHKVHILAVGVSEYADREIPALSYAAKDADDFLRAIEQQSGKAFTAVDKKILTNEDATLANVKAGLAWLDQQSSTDDISMLYLAGHGFNEDDGAYYYLPRDADLDKLATTALPNTELLAALKGAAGYAILFIDTCYAGAVARAARRPCDRSRCARQSDRKAAERHHRLCGDDGREAVGRIRSVAQWRLHPRSGRRLRRPVARQGPRLRDDDDARLSRQGKHQGPDCGRADRHSRVADRCARSADGAAAEVNFAGCRRAGQPSPFSFLP